MGSRSPRPWHWPRYIGLQRKHICSSYRFQDGVPRQEIVLVDREVEVEDVEQALEQTFNNDHTRLRIREISSVSRSEFYTEAVEIKASQGWQPIAYGTAGQEFSTSSGGINATTCQAAQDAAGNWKLRLSARCSAWEAEELLIIEVGKPYIRREQTYRFLTDWEGAVHPGWRVPNHPDYRYTFPLRIYDAPLAGVPSLRADVTWALPFPFHVWQNGQWVALYGVDRARSVGTLDFTPGAEAAFLRVYYPDTARQIDDLHQQIYRPAVIPESMRFKAGTELALSEIIGGQALMSDQEPLLEAEKIAADILLSGPTPHPDWRSVADGIAAYFRHSELWEPDAFGPGRGWFRNMWVYTHVGQPAKQGGVSGYFDLGWGEGIAAETLTALVRHWRRTKADDLLCFVDEITRNVDLYRRAPQPIGADLREGAAFYDRSDGRDFGDFLLGKRIWTHSLGHIGSQFIQNYADAPDYPRAETRRQWLRFASLIADFLATRQRSDGDLQDIFDEQDREANVKQHRITARAVVCGLWARLAKVTGQQEYLARSMRLARAVAPEVSRYEFYNQMIDAWEAPIEVSDGESAYYALEGLVPLYEATHDPQVLSLCQKAVAFGLSWTYFFDLPNAYRGIARGGQACRMPDFPLLYPIGPAKAIEPLLRLSWATGDPFYRRMAREMVNFIASYQISAPGKPWHGALVHAIDQHSGKFWGPDKCGQVDSGMATGNGLAAIELWLAEEGKLH